jgi:L-threonylcarbamoyladenylate synthase
VELVEAEDIDTRAAELLGQGWHVGLLAPAEPARSRRLRPHGLVVLDAPRDVDTYARVLYDRLREADRRALDVLLVVIPAETDGIGAAVRDRLERAAH